MEKINREPAPSGKAAGREKGAGCVKAHRSFSGGSLSFVSVAANRKPVRKKGQYAKRDRQKAVTEHRAGNGGFGDGRICRKAGTGVGKGIVEGQGDR